MAIEATVPKTTPVVTTPAPAATTTPAPVVKKEETAGTVSAAPAKPAPAEGKKLDLIA